MYNLSCCSMERGMLVCHLPSSSPSGSLFLSYLLKRWADWMCASLWPDIALGGVNKIFCLVKSSWQTKFLMYCSDEKGIHRICKTKNPSKEIVVVEESKLAFHLILYPHALLVTSKRFSAQGDLREYLSATKLWWFEFGESIFTLNHSLLSTCYIFKIKQ